MSKKKYKIPTVEELLKTKTIKIGKKEPIWVVLEREMRENADKKPYNKKVGSWLKFLRDFKHYMHRKRKRTYQKLKADVGPPWYYEFSERQRSILFEFKNYMHQDTLDNLPTRTMKAIKDLGITLKFTNEMLLKATMRSLEDTGAFFWYLYNMYYKSPPSELVQKYDMNAMLMMSALVFTDLEECRKEICRVTAKLPPPPPKPPKKHKKHFQPQVRFGEYLQKMYVPCVSNYPDKIPKPKKPLPLKNKIKLRSAESYEALAKANTFLEARLERNRKEMPRERVCTYKFWEPPSTLRNRDPKMYAYILKLKMFKEKARARHNKAKPPFGNIQCHIKGVSYSNGHPVYIVETIANIKTGYIPHNGGYIRWDEGYITNILGYYAYPREKEEKCESRCNCNRPEWEKKVLAYLEHTLCKCHHRYDWENEGKVKNQYFHPPKHGQSFWFDTAKVYHFDAREDFIEKEFRNALDSNIHTPTGSTTTVSPSKLKEKELLGAFLAELSETPLMIPHLPNANLLKNLQELVRSRVKGKVKKRKHRKLILQSQRQWVDFKQLNFRARPNMIPFTKQQLDTINFSHRRKIQKLFRKLLHDFESRTRKNMMDQTRLFWTTMKNDVYNSKGFLDAFFTYMPGRFMDTVVINPFSPDKTPKYGAKTCPLK